MVFGGRKGTVVELFPLPLFVQNQAGEPLGKFSLWLIAASTPVKSVSRAALSQGGAMRS